MQVFEELIDLCLAKGRPFAAFRLPDADMPRVVIELATPPDPSLHSPEFIFAPFVSSEASPELRIRADWDLRADSISGDYLWELQLSPDVAPMERPLPYQMTRTEHLELVQDTISHIEESATDKIVISRVEAINRAPSVSLPGLFLGLCQKYPTAYVSLVHHPKAGTWMGASPETLLKGWQSFYHTMALAGTRKLLPGMKDVSWRDKEREEQAMVARFIEQILRESKADILSQAGPMTSLAGQMAHLKTIFEFQYEGEIAALIHRLHPTPAVSGLPQQESINFILEHEPHERAYYAGYMGLLDTQGSTSLWVNLRNMQVFEKQFALYIGGGITADSQPMEEWQETQLKAGTLLSVIQNLSKFAPNSPG